MKHFYIFLKIGLLITLSLLFAFLVTKELYFTASLIILFIIWVAYSFYNEQRKIIKRMEVLINNIHYGDLNISFESTAKGAEGNLIRSMNEALSTFQTRLYNSVVAETENTAWQKLIRVLTHEIMNSIAPIISLSETITERAAENEMNESDYKIMLQSIQAIHRRSKGLLDFVENYRQLTRIPMPTLSPVLIADLFQSIQNLFPSEDIEFTFSIEPENLQIYADSTLIEQVLLNLLKNAIEACSDVSNGLIEIKAFREEGIPIITISDNGCGIVPEALDKIFVPFYTTKSGGSGIGLSICRQIMNRHSGSISINSEAGVGTTFTLRFLNTRKNSFL